MKVIQCSFSIASLPFFFPIFLCTPLAPVNRKPRTKQQITNNIYTNKVQVNMRVRFRWMRVQNAVDEIQKKDWMKARTTHNQSGWSKLWVRCYSNANANKIHNFMIVKFKKQVYMDIVRTRVIPSLRLVFYLVHVYLIVFCCYYCFFYLSCGAGCSCNPTLYIQRAAAKKLWKFRFSCSRIRIKPSQPKSTIRIRRWIISFVLKSISPEPKTISNWSTLVAFEIGADFSMSVRVC